MRFSAAWLDVLSDLLVNLAAGWFAVVFIEFSPFNNNLDFVTLTLKLILGIVSLIIAKLLREEIRKL